MIVTTSARNAALFGLTLLVSLCASSALAATLTWQGGSGSYCDPANWDVPLIPCNMVETHDVVFPDGTYTVTVDATCVSAGFPTCEVDTLSLGSGPTFRVSSAANTFSVLGNASISGNVDVIGGQLTAPDASFPGGSVSHAISVSSAGGIDFSGTTTLLPPTGSTALLELDLTGGGTIDLSSLQSISGTGGYTKLDVHSTSSLALPALITADDVQFAAHSGGQILVNGPQPAAYSSLGLAFGHFNLVTADGVGSLIDLSSITGFDLSYTHGFTTSLIQSVLASNDGVVDLSGLTTWTMPVEREDYFEIDLTTGGSVNLSSLAVIPGAGGYTRLDVHAGCSLSLPSLTTAEDVTFVANGGGQILVNGPQPVSYSSTGLVFTHFTLFNANGSGSLIDLSSLTSLDLGYTHGFTTSLVQSVLASNDGVVDLSGLTTWTMPVEREDYFEIDLTTGGSVNLSSLAVIPGAGGYTRLDVHAGCSLSLPSLTTAEDVTFVANGGGQILVNGPQPVSYSSTGLVFAHFTLFNANGSGSLIDLSSLTSLDLGYTHGFTTSLIQSVLASNDGVVDLSGLTTWTMPVEREDYFEIDLTTGGSVNLSSLAVIPGAGGYTRLDVHAGCSLSLPSLTTAEDVTFVANGGGQILVNGPQPVSYSSTGLVFTHFTLFNANGSGSLIDLSSLTSLDLGYTHGFTTSLIQSVLASNDGVVDLSGLTTWTMPVEREDYFEIDLTTGGSVNLSSLAVIPGAGGYTRLDVHAGCSLSLPSLTTAEDVTFVANGGGQILVNGPQPVSYSSTGLVFTHFTLVNANGADSLVDLSSVSSIDAGYTHGFTTSLMQSVIGASGGAVDLSGLMTVITPIEPEDRIVFDVSNGSTLTLAAPLAIGGAGKADFEVSTASALYTGDLSSTVTSSINLNHADITFDVNGTLDLGSTMTLVVDEAETSMTVLRSLLQAHDDPAEVELEASVLQMDGVDPQYFEAGGFDVGATRPVIANFGIGQLVAGQLGQPTVVRLRDVVDNDNGGPGAEALYLLGLDPSNADPRGLRIIDGSTLSLGCVETYVYDNLVDPAGELLNDLFVVPGTTRIAYDNGFLELDADTDGDGFPDCVDNCPRVYNPAQADGDTDGIGDLCDVTLDLSDPNVADPIDGLGAGSESGTSVSAAGDLNGDGIRDFLIGSPGYDPGGLTEAGAASIHLGSADQTERVEPDIIFVGTDAHDRTGVAVAGDFDFNGDGIPDILIGAEQTDRTVDPAVEVGAGKVYLIFFDPSDTTSYPNINDPGVVDTVDLSRVGNGQVDEIPGVVFTGVALGDRAGFSVAGGGRVDPGAGQDILIGAPGADIDANADAGAAYLIFDDPTLTGTVALGRVASGLGDEIDGILYHGGAADDSFGFAVDFPGDVVGTIGDDLAIGAPGADAAAPNAGVLFIPQGGDLARDIVEGCSIGDDDGVQGTQVRGTQAGEALASAVSGGGDNLLNGATDLLIGAPLYDRGLSLADEDAGRVAQTASKLPDGFIDADDIGAAANDPDAIPGVIWIGASGGDLLGTAVANLMDVTQDGLDDAALGAPGADPEGVVDAGIVYLVAGSVPPSFFLGTVDLALGFAGTQFIGSQAEELAGTSLAGPGDVDDDGDADFLVGAPGHDMVSVGDDTGRVYIVLDCGTADGDGDGVVDCEDNCPLVSNPAQEDGDGDGLGDVCDLCPDDTDPGQPDQDGDGFPDICDNCPFVSNPSQSDPDVDGVGTACDTNPIFTVSPDPTDSADFSTIQEAVNTVPESGTRIEVLADLDCYDGPIQVDRGKVLIFIGEDGACVDGGGGPAFDVRSTFSTTPITIRNFTLKGMVGVLGDAPTHVVDVTFEDITDVALDLNVGDHRVNGARADLTVNRGVDLALGASLTLELSTFDAIYGQAMSIAGSAAVENTLIARPADGIVLGLGASLILDHSTVVFSGGAGIDNSGGGAVSVAHSIVWGNVAGDLVNAGCSDASWSLICTPDCNGINDNLCADPLFVDDNADYHLTGGSPALDHGPDPALFTGVPCGDLDRGPRLLDHDGDGFAHVDIGAYEREAGLVPARVANLQWIDEQTLTWDVEPSAVEYHVYRDLITTLGYDAFGTCRDDLDSDRSDTELTDPGEPAAGDVWFYLITAEDSIGEEGSLGLATCAERSNFTPCP